MQSYAYSSLFYITFDIGTVNNVVHDFAYLKWELIEMHSLLYLKQRIMHYIKVVQLLSCMANGE